jgi:hypothetical protein
MAWQYVEIADNAGATDRQFASALFLNQFIEILDTCAELYTWAGFGTPLDYGIISVGDGASTLPQFRWNALQTRIESLAAVMVDYDAIANTNTWNGSSYAVHPWMLGATVGVNAYAGFKTLANALITTANHDQHTHKLATGSGDGMGWFRINSAGTETIGKTQPGDVINTITINQIYACCDVLRAFAVLAGISNSNAEGNTSLEGVYTASGTNEDEGEQQENIDDAIGIQSGANWTDATWTDVDPPVFVKSYVHGGWVGSPDEFITYTGTRDKCALTFSGLQTTPKYIKTFGVIEKAGNIFDGHGDSNVGSSIAGEIGAVVEDVNSPITATSYITPVYGDDDAAATPGNPVSSLPSDIDDPEFYDTRGYYLKPWICVKLDIPVP